MHGKHGNLITEIVDHHKDNGAHSGVTGAKRCIAFEANGPLAASACSVVCEKFLAHPKGREILARDSGAAARALLGCILIDSANLDPKKKKVQPRDIAAAKELETFMKRDPTLFDQLDEAKFSPSLWTSMDVKQCMRYDFKKFEAKGKTVGLSAVLCDLKKVSGKKGFVDECQKNMAEYDVFIILVQAKQGGAAEGNACMQGLAKLCGEKKEPVAVKTARQIAVMSTNTGMAAHLADFLLEYKSPGLELEHLSGLTGPDGMKSFEQRNLSASRKQVGPAVLAFFETL